MWTKGTRLIFQYRPWQEGKIKLLELLQLLQHGDLVAAELEPPVFRQF